MRDLFIGFVAGGLLVTSIRTMRRGEIINTALNYLSVVGLLLLAGCASKPPAPTWPPAAHPEWRDLDPTLNHPSDANPEWIGQPCRPEWGRWCEMPK